MADRQRLNLMILGARRSGTTSLGWYLMEHPEIYHVTYDDFERVGGLKVNYPYNIPFASLTLRSDILNRYTEVSPTDPHRKDPQTLKYVLNRAVYAIYYPHILFNIAEHMPDLRIVMSLRDPVAATYSAYCHQRERQKYDESFEEKVMPRIDLHSDPRDLPPSQVPGAVARSVYEPGIRMIQRLFPAEQIRIMPFEAHTGDTEGTMRQTCRFLGVDDSYAFERLAKIRGRTEKPAPMTREASDWLYAFFEPYNQSLFDILGWPADTWTKA